MEFRHLRYLLAVAEEATFVRAAERLRVAQPALSRQIHDLEKEMGVELFVRGPRGAQLTPAGHVCVSAARYLLRQTAGAFERAREASDGMAGRCVLCIGKRPIWSGFIARIVAETARAYPHIELHVEEGDFDRQWSMIETFEADIGLALPAPAERMALASETHSIDVFDSVLLSTSHPLATREEIALTELRDYDLFSYDAAIAPEPMRLLHAEFRRMRFAPRRERALHSVQAVVSHVAAGLGWTIVPGRSNRMPVMGTVIVPLSDFKLPVPVAIVRRRDDHRPLIDRMVALIMSVPAVESRSADDSDGTPLPLHDGAPGPDHAQPPGAPGIELRHLRYFAAVVEEESIGRAAERLGLTQPALSRQIRDLEREARVALLERDARGVSPTLAGSSLYRDVLHVLEEVAALPAEAQRARRGMISRCVLGIAATPLVQHLVTRALAMAHEHDSDCELMIEEMATPRQPLALRDARIDIGLCHASPVSAVHDRGIRREYLLSDRLSCALLPGAHPLVSRTAIRLADLTDLPFVFISRQFQPPLYDAVYSAFADEDFEPRIFEGTHDMLGTIWSLVAEGRGWALGFESQRDEPPPGCAVVPVENLSLRWGVDLIHREDESRTTVLLVLDMIRDAARARRHRAAVPALRSVTGVTSRA